MIISALDSTPIIEWLLITLFRTNTIQAGEIYKATPGLELRWINGLGRVENLTSGDRIVTANSVFHPYHRVYIYASVATRDMIAHVIARKATQITHTHTHNP